MGVIVYFHCNSAHKHIITAFNVGFDLAMFATYLAFIGDGNHVTNLVSIGAETSKTGPNVNESATGFNTHIIFEG